jgi:hypothetical protein
MSKITYEIVEHDGGWAYRVGAVFSETFPSHDLARKRSAQRRNKWFRERRPASRTRTRMVAGTMKCRQAMTAPKPTSKGKRGAPTTGDTRR